MTFPFRGWTMCRYRNWKMPSVLFCNGFVPPDTVMNVVERNPRHEPLIKPVSGNALLSAVRSRLSRNDWDPIMRIIESVAEMQATAREMRRQGLRIGFVPTMGFLHAGHVSLVRRARSVSDRVVVSIFVNPTQFGPNEDYAAYPRDPERDAAVCRDEGVDALFCPAAEEMYPDGHTVRVDEESLSAGLCGAARPGHFRGVLTVVAKLFNIVQPDVAVFGRKDAQQARLIEQMVRDLNFPLELIVAPTVREPDGLAMSSRNAHLSPEERQRATCLHQSLCLAERMYLGGTRDAAEMRAAMRRMIEAIPGARIEYIEVVDHDTFKPVETIAAPAVIALRVRIGRTRIIDNTIVG